jgi:hypothetical protein
MTSESKSIMSGGGPLGAMHRGLLRVCLWSLAAAVVLVGLWWLAWAVAGEEGRSVINGITNVVFEPALAALLLVTGEAHDISGVGWFAFQVVEIFVVIALIVGAVTLAKRAARR